MTKLHQSLKKKFASLSTCATNCSKNESSCDKWCVPCCSWKEELVRHHRKKERSTVQWKCLSSNKWPSSQEEVIKVFIPNLHNDPKLTLDLPNIMSLFENCTIFNIHRDLIKAIRKVRNVYICHNGECKINDNNLQKCFNRMFTLLQDASVKYTVSGKEGLGKLSELKEKGILDFLKDKSQENNEFAKLVISVEQLKSQNCEIQEQLTEIKHHTLQKECTARQITGSSRLSHTPQKECTARKITGSGRLSHTLQKECTARQITGSGRLAGRLDLVATILIAMFVIFITCISMPAVSKVDFQHENQSGCISMEFTEPWENEIGFHGYLSDYINIIGREWLTEYITSEITVIEGGLLLSADMGYGKTALVSKLLCANPSSSGYKLRQNILAFHMCKYDVLTTQQPDKFIRNIAGKIAYEVPEFELKIANAKKFLEPPRCAEDPVGCLDAVLIFPLQQITKYEKHIIVIDALDECDSGLVTDGPSVLSLLIKRIHNFPKWIKFIVTSRNIPSITTRFTNLKHIHLDESNSKHLHDIEKYIVHRLFSYNDLSSNTSIQEDINYASQELIQRSKGNFLFLKHTIDLMIKMKQIHSDKLPNSLEEVYLQNFERVFGNNMDSFKKTKVIFEIMCASCEPLPVKESELLDIANISEQPIDEDIFKHLANNLGHFLVYHKEELHFTHKSVRDWLTDDNRRYGPFSISLNKGHELISKYFMSELYKTYVPGKNLYRIIRLPLHVSKSKDEDTKLNFLHFIKIRKFGILLLDQSHTIVMIYMSWKINFRYMTSMGIINATYGLAETLKAWQEFGVDFTWSPL